MPQTHAMNLEQLSKYFHLPINEVAKELGICATVLKKICRRNGIPRWPHRKIKSLDKMIKTLESTVAKTPDDADRIKREIAGLHSKKMFLMKNPNVLGSKSSKKSSPKFLSPASVLGTSGLEHPQYRFPKFKDSQTSVLHQITSSSPISSFNNFGSPQVTSTSEWPSSIKTALSPAFSPAALLAKSDSVQRPPNCKTSDITSLLSSHQNPSPFDFSRFNVPKEEISSIPDASFNSLKLPEIKFGNDIDDDNLPKLAILEPILNHKTTEQSSVKLNDQWTAPIGVGHWFKDKDSRENVSDHAAAEVISKLAQSAAGNLPPLPQTVPSSSSFYSSFSFGKDGKTRSILNL